MSFPSETEIIESCKWARERGFKITPWNWDEKDGTLCPLAAVVLKRRGGNSVATPFAISLDCNYGETNQFIEGFDALSLNVTGEKEVLGVKLRKMWDEGKL